MEIGDIQLIDTISVHNFPFTPDGILHCTPHCMEKKKTQISVITLRHAHHTPTPTTIAHLIPKITTSLQGTHVLLSKDKKTSMSDNTVFCVQG